MKIISYSFDVQEFTSDNVKQIVDVIKSIDNIAEERSHLSEVIITTSSSANNSLLENFVADQNIRSTSVKIVTSDKRSKTFTRPTLVADTFCGDTLVITRNHRQMSTLLFALEHKRSIDWNDLFSNHLVFLATSNYFSEVDSRLYREINRRYGGNLLIHENTVGLVASRQSINSIMSAERDIYDLFVSLAVSNIDRTFRMIGTFDSSTRDVYKKDEVIEILSRFCNTSYIDHLSPIKKSALLISILSMIFIIAFSVKIHRFDMIPSAAIFAILSAFLALDSAYHHLLIISRQSFAAANKKYIAGNAIIYQINKKN